MPVLLTRGTDKVGLYSGWLVVIGIIILNVLRRTLGKLSIFQCLFL